MEKKYKVSREEGLAIGRYEDYYKKHLPFVKDLDGYWVPDFDETAYSDNIGDRLDKLTKYLNELRPYANHLKKAADLRNQHYIEFIKSNPERIEEINHRNWRKGLLLVAKDTLEKLEYWTTIRDKWLDEAIYNYEQRPLSYVKKIGHIENPDKISKSEEVTKFKPAKRPKLSKSEKFRRKLALENEEQKRESKAINEILEKQKKQKEAIIDKFDVRNAEILELSLKEAITLVRNQDFKKLFYFHKWIEFSDIDQVQGYGLLCLEYFKMVFNDDIDRKTESHASRYLILFMTKNGLLYVALRSFLKLFTTLFDREILYEERKIFVAFLVGIHPMVNFIEKTFDILKEKDKNQTYIKDIYFFYQYFVEGYLIYRYIFLTKVIEIYTAALKLLPLENQKFYFESAIKKYLTDPSTQVPLKYRNIRIRRDVDYVKYKFKKKKDEILSYMKSHVIQNKICYICGLTTELMDPEIGLPFCKDDICQQQYYYYEKHDL